MNVYGVPKPAYRSFQLLHELGNELVSASITDAKLAGDMDAEEHEQLSTIPNCSSTVGVLASVSNATTLSVLLFSQAAIGVPIARSCEINVSILNPTADHNSRHRSEVEFAQGTIRRIDETHTAPKAIWLQQGMPQWPTAQQKEAMFDGSIMRKEKLEIAVESTVAPVSVGSNLERSQRLSFSVSVAANSVVAVQVPIGSERDLLEAERERDTRVALASAEKQLQETTAKIAALRKSLRVAHD